MYSRRYWAETCVCLSSNWLYGFSSTPPVSKEPMPTTVIMDGGALFGLIWSDRVYIYPRLTELSPPHTPRRWQRRHQRAQRLRGLQCELPPPNRRGSEHRGRAAGAAPLRGRGSCHHYGLFLPTWAEQGARGLWDGGGRVALNQLVSPFRLADPGVVTCTCLSSSLTLYSHQLQYSPKAVDYGTQEFQKVCKAAKIDCHFADPRDIDIPRGWDGVHPTDEGQSLVCVSVSVCLHAPPSLWTTA